MIIKIPRPAPEKEVIETLKKNTLTLVSAESCTAGLIAATLAKVPGASSVFWGGFVVYTPDAKEKMLGIEKQYLDAHGAVSRETACAMAERALEKSGAGFAISVTGLAGPDGDASGLPIGTVWIGHCKHGGKADAQHFLFSGSRNEIREAARNAALKIILTAVV
jgi:PncC family amidohydrolase